MKALILILFFTLPWIAEAGPVSDSAQTGLTLGEEPYVDDIPFDTERIFLSHLALEMDKSIADIRPEPEAAADDIPFDTWQIAGRLIEKEVHSRIGRHPAVPFIGPEKPVKPVMASFNANQLQYQREFNLIQRCMPRMKFELLIPDELNEKYDTIMNHRVFNNLMQ